MKQFLFFFLLFFLIKGTIFSQNPYEPKASIPGVTPIKFRPQIIAAESFESVGVFDVNGDKILDLVSGSYWYQGPDYLNRHFIDHGKRYGEYWDDFSTIPMDINGDGRLDFVTGGFWGNTIRWKANPGKDEEWKETIIAETGSVECTRAWDVDGDGLEEIVPNTPGNPLSFYKLEKDQSGKPLGTFHKYRITNDGQGHGLGFGDINGDGRGDFVMPDGWVEAPVDRLNGQWIIHKDFNLGTASVPILVADVNSDGKSDLIVGQGHSYGLDWYEQQLDKTGKKRTWKKHAIDPYNSQFHTMEWIDLDGDGKQELITGKRYRAHNNGDIGPNDPLGIYYYKWNGESFTKQIISHGQVGVGKGTGIYFAVADLKNTGRKDIIVAGKDGLWIFFNEGN